ncbi:hypothetical protein [Nitrolancea hollandica]|uniref:Uncharacterized protein n=1 Tax=Nitrolancea hollandica Lb TaxID=1129897 RepID=I4ELR4_9BACT|nr:hypothetical protein [Nitrolancea hollandica]CCF85626.1 hypothetical protein NITHO_5240013 [Nitrolancea hollandica Lb]
MQEERHEPYQQPPPTTEQQARQAQQAEQKQAMQAERQQAQQPMPTRAPEEQGEKRETLFTPEQREQYRSRWQDIQIEFVTDPHKSAEDASHLVSEMVQDLEKQLNDRCSNLEHAWQQGKPSTEDLRIALGHYQSFFDRLLSV